MPLPVQQFDKPLCREVSCLICGQAIRGLDCRLVCKTAFSSLSPFLSASSGAMWGLVCSKQAGLEYLGNATQVCATLKKRAHQRRQQVCDSGYQPACAA